MTENESVTRSLRSTIEAAVLELIYQGDERGYWEINWPVNKIIENEVEEIVHSATFEIIDEVPIKESEGEDDNSELPIEVPTPENIDKEEIRG